MREILFRGKRVDNGEWVYGYLCVFKGVSQMYVPFTEEEEKENEGHIFSAIGGVWHIIIPETVGQYTGLTDKNGKKIFEGDIVKYDDLTGIINYSFGCYCVKTNKPDWRNRNNPAIDIVFNEYPNEIKVIGNIHDNPELLEGGEE